MLKMSEIARELGISRTTVSLCLSGKAEKYKISPKTIKRVQDYAGEFGYVPNIMAQSLGNRKKEVLGLLFDLSVFGTKNQITMNHAVQELATRDWNYFIQHYSKGEFISAITRLKGLGVTAVIVIGVYSLDRKLLKQLDPFLKDMRLFFIDYSFDGPVETEKNVYLIGIDRKISYLNMFEQLYRLGHTRIAIEGGINEKLKAYHEFLNLHSLPFQQELCLSYKSSRINFKTGQELLDKVLKLIEKHKITAVSMHDDQVAAGLSSALLDHGISVPEDISIIGFDNIDSASFFRVPLATIEVPIRNMIDIALTAICDEKKISQNSILEGKFIIRQSVTEAKK